MLFTERFTGSAAAKKSSKSLDDSDQSDPRRDFKVKRTMNEHQQNNIATLAAPDCRVGRRGLLPAKENNNPRGTTEELRGWGQEEGMRKSTRIEEGKMGR